MYVLLLHWSSNVDSYHLCFHCRTVSICLMDPHIQSLSPMGVDFLVHRSKLSSWVQPYLQSSVTGNNGNCLIGAFPSLNIQCQKSRVNNLTLMFKSTAPERNLKCGFIAEVLDGKSITYLIILVMYHTFKIC